MSMEDAYEPLSPSEAAKILSNSRWERDAAQRRQVPEDTSGEEPTLYGKQSVEASQNWSEMPLANPISKESGEAIDGSELSESLRTNQAQVAEPIPVQYLEQRGERAGQPMAENLSISAEQGASDLNRFRETIGEQIEAFETKQIADAIDQLRAGDQQQQAQPVEQQPQTPQPEAQVQPQAPADDEVAKALQNPRILAAVQEHAQQYAAQADQIAQRYIQATAVNAQSAYANLLASFPEVANVRPDQLGTALQVLAQSNPERAQTIQRHVETVTRLTQEAQRAQAAQYAARQQEYQRQWDVAAKSHDAEYEAFAKANFSDEQNSEIRNEASAMLREFMTDEQIAGEWNSNSLFRSYAAQRLMADAARWRISQRALSGKTVRPEVPKVQRPGSPADRPSASEYEFQSLNDKVNRTTGREQIRAAAALIAARRARR
jgi:hypothetical protein